MTTKVKIKPAKSGVNVFALAKHPMETGQRKDKKTGKLVPAHFITNMEFSVNGTTAVTTHLSPGVSKNPLITVNVNAKSGDTVAVNWVDNKGESGSGEATVK